MKDLPDNDTWLKSPKPNPDARLRLFCFPFAGGGATVFREWPHHLPGEVEVQAVRLPGRESRLKEAPFTRLPELVEVLAQVLQPRFQAMPFAFFGHSIGSLVAFELARKLRSLHLPGPRHLFVSSRNAPQLPYGGLHLHHLSDADFVSGLREYNGTPEAVLRNEELMELFLPALKADFALLETYAYRAESRLACPITAFGGVDDHSVSRKDLLPWGDQTHESFSVQMFPGDHFYLMGQQKALLTTIGNHLQPLDLCRRKIGNG